MGESSSEATRSEGSCTVRRKEQMTATASRSCKSHAHTARRCHHQVTEMPRLRQAARQWASSIGGEARGGGQADEAAQARHPAQRGVEANEGERGGGGQHEEGEEELHDEPVAGLDEEVQGDEEEGGHE